MGGLGVWVEVVRGVGDYTEEAGRSGVLEAPGFGTRCVDVVYSCGRQETGWVWRVLHAEVFCGLVFILRSFIPLPVLVL